ncbi:MAG TPA: MarR family transcriptional regulator [Pirellulales bacterium]|nr:MarR family transcriptional regulator [Pirellulales bacterium]
MSSPAGKAAEDRAAEDRAVPFDSPEQEAYLNLWRTYDRLKALEESLFADYGLTAQQYNALRLLRAQRPDSLPTLAIGARLISRAPDITRLVNKLAERGLVERKRDLANRRIVNVTITRAGLDLLDTIAAPLAECHQRQLGHLTAEQLRRLIELLKLARQPHEADRSRVGR